MRQDVQVYVTIKLKVASLAEHKVDVVAPRFE